MRVPSGEPELVRAGAAGDPAALAALWDAYGARVFAFSQRVLGNADAAADAAQDAFLLAHAELGSLARSGGSFGVAAFRAAQTTCDDLLARDGGTSGGGRAGAPSLSVASARLRPRQRAALALAGLERLSYAEIAAVLGVGAEGVGALLARARLRLHDELRGTAVAAAAVRSPDCEDVLAVLAAASDGELGPADAGWADPHVEQCPTCPRTRRAIDETAAAYAAWSPALPPAWLGAATLAELGLEAPAPAAAARAALAGAAPVGAVGGSWASPAWATPRPRPSAALLGAMLLTVAFAALALAVSGALRQRDPLARGVGLPGPTGSLRVAGVPPEPPARRARAPKRTARAKRPARRPSRVAFAPVRAVQRVPSSAPPAAPSLTRPRPRRPAPPRRPTPKPGPPPATPQPAPAPAAPVAPAPVTADAPADELPSTSSAAAASAGSTVAAEPASSTTPSASPTALAAPAAQASAPAPPPKTTTTPPSAPTPSLAAAQPAGGDRDRDRGGGWEKSDSPCAPQARGQRRSDRH